MAALTFSAKYGIAHLINQTIFLYDGINEVRHLKSI